jgi:hypothetical protein
VPILGEHSERRISSGRRQVLGKNPWEDEPDPVRDAVGLFVPIDPNRKWSSSDAKNGAGGRRKK